MWLKTIRDVAEQLCHLIRDYDVAYTVAELYVKMRVHDSIESEREFYITNFCERRIHPMFWYPFFISYREKSLLAGHMRPYRSIPRIETKISLKEIKIGVGKIMNRIE